MNIQIIAADAKMQDGINTAIKNELSPKLTELREKHGSELADIMTENEIASRLTAAEKAVADGLGFAAEVCGKLVGFVSVADFGGRDTIGSITCLVGESDEIKAELQAFAIGKLRERGKTVARMHAFIGEFAGAFTCGLPEVTYFMDLSAWENKGVKADIDIVPTTEDHSEAVQNIVIEGWKPIRKAQKALIGEISYNAMFTNWEANKAKSVIICAFGGKPGRCCFSAISDGRVAGVLTAHFTDGEIPLMEIGNNSVSAEFAGRGIGSSMYRFILGEAKKRGCRYASVETGLDDGHAPARRAYEKAGFSRDTAIETINYYMPI